MSTTHAMVCYTAMTTSSPETH